MKKLTSSSYVLLGLLSRHPWSAYELAQYMQRSIMRRIWPRAESELYREVKQLRAHKLANSRSAKHGGRQRTVYSISAGGRRALDEWLTVPGKNLQYEHEELVKLALSYHVHTDEALNAHISEIERQAMEEAAVIVSVGESMSNAPDRMNARDVPYSTLTVSYIRHIVEAQFKWVKHVREITSDLDYETDNADWSKHHYEAEIQTLKRQLGRLQEAAKHSG